MKRKLGFTLIELVIVIVILGILAVVAAPKFMSIQSDARKADLQQLAGAIRTSMSLAYSKATILGLEDKAVSSIDVNGHMIELAKGYPAATMNGIVKTIESPEDWHPIIPEISFLHTKYKASGVMIFSPNKINQMTAEEAVKSHCFVIYMDLSSVSQSENHDGGNESSSPSSWFDGIVCLVLDKISGWVGINLFPSICPTGNQSADGTGDNLPSLNVPMIKVVDDKC